MLHCRLIGLRFVQGLDFQSKTTWSRAEISEQVPEGPSAYGKKNQFTFDLLQRMEILLASQTLGTCELLWNMSSISFSEALGCSLSAGKSRRPHKT